MSLNPVGLVESFSAFRVRGWAFDKNDPKLALDLVLRVNGVACLWFRPNMRYPALAQHLGWSDQHIGLVAFDIALPTWVANGSAHTIEVMVSASGQVLPPGASLVEYQSPHIAIDNALAFPPLGGEAPLAPLMALPPQGAPQVALIVLNRNGSEVLQHLFQSWAQHNQTVPVEWIVVDHASTDGSLAMLRHWQTQLPMQVVALDYNDSFSASCNRATRLATAPHLLFLNNDIIWLHDALPSLLTTLSDSSVAAVGLKLLKASGTDLFAKPGHTQVQHLGVRFCQAADGYAPYEATPSQAHIDQEFSAQSVPAATAAVLLVRRAEFDAVGGFDESYFYGFEDVELCLRLQHRLGKKIVCRNDLVALHRHGHTRLTGREGSSQFDRITNNAKVLAAQTGVWSKHQWWQSLLSNDQGLCAEYLVIGLQVDQIAPDSQPMQRAMQWIAAARLSLPHARWLLVHPGVDGYDVRNIHILVVGSATYDIRQLRHARADLFVLACVAGAARHWVTQPWWLSFNAYLAANTRAAKAVRALSAVAIAVPTATQPLGPGLVANTWPMRIGIDWPQRGSKGNPTSLSHATTLQATLKTAGLACWLLPLDPRPAELRVIDAYVMLWPHSAHGGKSAKPAPKEATVNLLWHTCRAAHAKAPHSRPRRSQKLLPTQALSAAQWIEVDQAPTAEQLIQNWKKQIEHTFSAS